jgi:hypothetical protein
MWFTPENSEGRNSFYLAIPLLPPLTNRENYNILPR